MSQSPPSSPSPASAQTRSTQAMLIRRLGLGLSSLGMLGGTVAQAQTLEILVPDVPDSSQASVPAVEKISAVPTAVAQPEALPSLSVPEASVLVPLEESGVPQVEAAPVKDTQVEVNQVEVNQVEASKIESPAPRQDLVYDAPTEIVVSDRTSGCEKGFKVGEAVDGVCGGSAATATGSPIAPPPPPNWTTSQSQPSLPIPPISLPPATQLPATIVQRAVETVASRSSRVGPMALGNPIAATTNTLAMIKPYFNPNLRVNKLPADKDLNLIFPVAIPSPITSLFGWRTHPISGDHRMHTGTDIGADLGTPVLAAMSGRVLLADILGGYGQTIALEHNNGVQQTLYAHLSEIFVKPGQVVEQGTVIGRVGSTGNSTGPHLHFELRQQLPDGSWVARDSGQALEASLAQLVQSLQVAQKPAPVKQKLSPQQLAQLLASQKLIASKLIARKPAATKLTAQNFTPSALSRQLASQKAPTIGSR